jgi:hypothetical protein
MCAMDIRERIQFMPLSLRLASILGNLRGRRSCLFEMDVDAETYMGFVALDDAIEKSYFFLRPIRRRGAKPT